ncbi:MAG: hypothetical protein ACYTG0_25065 [Planctomycetota bacterium]|jgi:hypothetical protein
MKPYAVPNKERIEWIIQNYAGETPLGELFKELGVHIEALWTAIDAFNAFVTTATPADLATEPGVIMPDPATKGFKFTPCSIPEGGQFVPIPGTNEFNFVLNRPAPPPQSGQEASKQDVPAEKRSTATGSVGSDKPGRR